MKDANVKTPKRALAVLCACVVLIAGLMALAAAVQCDFGRVRVENYEIPTELGTISAKLYVPRTASAETPAPAVLLLHGYQNDKDTCSAYAIELARRGYVVMAADEYGHGSDTIGMIERGFVNHRVRVNFGEDSVEDGTFVPSISGPNRYKLMMNFSNLSFFDERYTRDDDGNTLKDSAMGGIQAYAALSALDFVDPHRMAVSGHSMGTWASWSVAAAYSGTDIAPRAVVLQCGELFSDNAYDAERIKFNNVLLLQAKYDEFSYFRDYQPTVSDALLDTPLRRGFLGIDETGEWNTTYGSFDDGSARRIELLYTNHRLTTHNHHGLRTAIEWFDAATGTEPSLEPARHTFMIREVSLLLCLFLSLVAACALMNILLCLPFFSDVRQSVHAPGGQSGFSVRGAVITMLIAGLSYPFMTQLGHGVLPLPESVFRMTIGNGFVSWYLLLILVMIGTTLFSRRRAKKAGGALTMYDLGLAAPSRPNRFGWALLGKSALLVLAMCALIYVLVGLSQLATMQDFRFIWPFIKTFSLERFGQFWVYILFYAVFFVLNNSKIFMQINKQTNSEGGARGFLGAWWKNALCMAGGIFLVCLIEYVPFFAGLGPGADLLFGSTFGGPFMSLLLVFFPQVLVLSVLCTYIHRRTGHVFVSGLMAAALSCWIITGGSAIL